MIKFEIRNFPVRYLRKKPREIKKQEQIMGNLNQFYEKLFCYDASVSITNESAYLKDINFINI